MKFALLVLLFCAVAFAQKLSVSGNQIMWNGQSVFLNGINQAWVNYGMDFGNGNSAQVWSQQMSYLDRLQAAGGNSIRYWLFVEGQNIPQFNGQGYVTAPDNTGNLINDATNYVREASKRGIVVIFCLWNAAVMSNPNEVNLFWDTGKLQSFIDTALVPLVTALQNEPGLGAWEILNEPEAAVSTAGDPNPCFDGSKLAGSGAGWAGANIPMKNILQFINLQADAIKRAVPSALVTVGSWSERAITDNYGYTNYYKDSCLIAAGGKTSGVLDFYQVHSYSWNGNFGQYAPFKVNAASYNLNKPLVLGEFSEDLGDGHGGGGMTSVQLSQYAANNGYVGGWGWADQGAQKDLFFDRIYAGVQAIRGITTALYANGAPGSTPANPPPSNPPSNPSPPSTPCVDVPPSSQYTCAQQQSWGQCSQSWMAGYCQVTCGTCPSVSCSDTPPSSQYTCAQQQSWGQCSQSWMAGYCQITCGTCPSNAASDSVDTFGEQIGDSTFEESFGAEQAVSDSVLPDNNAVSISNDNTQGISVSSVGIIVAGVVVGVLMVSINVIFMFSRK
jgi:mannan endo-1,4-beta-mannosidase